MIREIPFVAAFTGQLSHVQGLSLPFTNLRVEQGHRYVIQVDEQTGAGRLTDLGIEPVPEDRGAYAGVQQQ